MFSIISQVTLPDSRIQLRITTIGAGLDTLVAWSRLVQHKDHYESLHKHLLSREAVTLHALQGLIDGKKADDSVFSKPEGSLEN